MLDDDIAEAARGLYELCKSKGLTLATAESCTVGMAAGMLGDIPGVSSVLDRGFVTYSNQAKQDMLGVQTQTLKDHGAVSRETAEEMARGALEHAPVDLTVSITGVAGPDGGTPAKPVGLVHFAAASRSGQMIHAEQRYGAVGRMDVRKRSVLQALRMLHEIAEKEATKA